MMPNIKEKDSRSNIVESVYVTSEPEDENWGQPAASRYIFRIEGNRMLGTLVSGVYTPQSSLELEPPSDLATEFEAWDLLSDEALLEFEAQLDE